MISGLEPCFVVIKPDHHGDRFGGACNLEIYDGVGVFAVADFVDRSDITGIGMDTIRSEDDRATQDDTRYKGAEHFH